MTSKKRALINVAFNISGAIVSVEKAMGRVEYCGLNASKQEEVTECLRKGMRLLETAYDIVDCEEC